MEWFQKHWSNAVTLGGIIIAGLVLAWQQTVAGVPTLPRLQGAWQYVPLILLITAGLAWWVGRRNEAKPPQRQASGIIPGIPTLSALLGQNPNVEFDAKKFFALAYYSPVTAEAENNVKIIAQKNSPDNKEAFYARFIGVGLVAYQHDTTWYLIFGSQLKALAELNSCGLLPIADVKKHYEKAVVDYPKTYENYPFDDWLNFMKSRSLIVVYPSQMVEASFAGIDFLKYLSHVGRSVNGKPN